MAKSLYQELKENYKLSGVAIVSIILYVGLIVCTCWISNKDNRGIVWVSVLCSIVMGWIIAILTTPYDKSDEKQIGKFTKIVGSFLTGYILSKLDKVLERALAPEIVLSDQYGVRLLLCIAYFGVTWIFIFCFRQYSRIGEV